MAEENKSPNPNPPSPEIVVAESSTQHTIVEVDHSLETTQHTIRLSDLYDPEQTSLQSFKKLLNQSLVGQDSMYGVPLFQDQRTDTILLKFLRARKFNVNESLTMITNTLKWRKDFKIDSLLNKDLGNDLDRVVFMHGLSREGQSVCYNVYGNLQTEKLHDKILSNQRTDTFLEWMIKFMEKSIRDLDFNPGGVNTVFQVHDFKNSAGPTKKELRAANKQALKLFHDHYPEFVAKQVFINVPWWNLASYTMTKSKSVFAGPNKFRDTLFKYISPEQLQVQYGGLRDPDHNTIFSTDDPATDIPVKPDVRQFVEIPIYEKCFIYWQLRVVGWEVSFGAYFMPDAGKQAHIIQDDKKMLQTDKQNLLSHRVQLHGPGIFFITVDNLTSKEKKLIYRFKFKSYV